jgi:hypothetical protein
LLAVVWELWTQTSRSTDISPYYLLYGSDAILPADIAFWALRIKNFWWGTVSSSSTRGRRSPWGGVLGYLCAHSQVSRRPTEIPWPQCAWMNPCGLLVFVNANRKIHKRMDSAVAFIREYSKVSISTGNANCTN